MPVVGDLDIPYLILFSFKLLEANGQDEIRRCIDLVTRDRIWSLSNRGEMRSSLGYCISTKRRGHCLI